MASPKPRREGFWLYRFLQAQGIINSVVDSSSIEVNRRWRRAKSDGLDVRKLVSMLIRYAPSQDLTAKVHTIIRTTIAQYYVNQAVTHGLERQKGSSRDR